MELVRFLLNILKIMDIKRLVLVKFFTTMHPKESSRFPEEGLLVLVRARINQLSGVIKELQQTGGLILK